MNKLLIATALLLTTPAIAEPLTGKWGGTLAMKSSSMSSRCAAMGVDIAVVEGGGGTITLSPVNDSTRPSSGFKLNDDGTFSMQFPRPIGAVPITGTLTATGGTVDYSNPTGCQYAGQVGRK